MIEKLKVKEQEYLSLDKDARKEYYYNIRKMYNSCKLIEHELSVEKAVLFIFLNRTCFNGLYRVNKAGDFNVPMGKYQKPTICHEENLRALSELIQNVNFEYGDYTNCKKYIKENTFIYFDPPYRPLNITSGFTSYTKEDFNDDNQKELSKVFKELSGQGVKLMLTNSNPKNVDKKDNFFEKIYHGFNIHEVYAKRMINSKSDCRGEISELLITNYNE